jgi:hypothetical protein
VFAKRNQIIKKGILKMAFFNKIIQKLTLIKPEIGVKMS